MEIVVNSPNVKYTEHFIEAKYEYQHATARKDGNKIVVSGYNLVYSRGKK